LFICSFLNKNDKVDFQWLKHPWQVINKLWSLCMWLNVYWCLHKCNPTVVSNPSMLLPVCWFQFSFPPTPTDQIYIMNDNSKRNPTLKSRPLEDLHLNMCQKDIKMYIYKVVFSQRWIRYYLWSYLWTPS
jgi:hypothetical protein